MCVFNAIWYILHLLSPLKTKMDLEYVDLKNCSLAYSFNAENIFERSDFLC